MRGWFGPTRDRLERVLVVESGARESGELLLGRLVGQAGARGLDVLTCYDSAPVSLTHFAGGECFSVHAPEAVENRTAFAGRLARQSYDAVIVLCTGSGVLARWKWLLMLKTQSRLVFADEFGEHFFVTLRNPGPLVVLALRRSRIGSVPELLVALLRVLAAPFVIAFLVAHAAVVHAKRILRGGAHKPLT